MLHKESTFQVFQFASSTRKLLNKRRHNYLQPATKKIIQHLQLSIYLSVDACYLFVPAGIHP